MKVSARMFARSAVLAGCLSAALVAPAAAISPSFDAPRGLDLPGPAGAVAAGDFDGDGTEDLAAAYGLGQGAVSLWRGTGDPADPFVHVTPDVAVGVAPQAVLARDFDGDGRDDLVVANSGSTADDADDDVTILLGSANGLVKSQTLPARDAPSTLDAGDLDGDGDLDVVVGNFGIGTVGEPSVHVSVLTGSGDGRFQVAHHAVNCRPSGVAIADLVAGDRPEVAVGCISGQAVTRIFALNAAGFLEQVGNGHPGCDGNPSDVAAGNFDGAGTADIAVVCVSRWFTVLASDLGFAPLTGPNHTAGNPEPRFPAISPAGVGAQLVQVDVADVNSDGYDDVLTADIRTGAAIVADGRANGHFAPETLVGGELRVGTAFELRGGFLQVIAADVNEDGKRDLVAAVGSRIVTRLATTPVPGVRTGLASSVGHAAATVGAIVNPSGTTTANDTTYRFEYGRTAAYGRTTAALPEGRSLGGGSYIPVSAVLSGLTPQTEYHYRVVASNGHGTTYGRDRTFRTGATPAPPQSPPAAVDGTAPRLTLSVPRTARRARLVRRGLRATVGANEPARLVVELLGSARSLRSARVGDVVLAERRLPVAAGRRTVTLRPPKRFRSRLRSRFALTVRVTAVDAAGNRTVATRQLKVR